MDEDTENLDIIMDDNEEEDEDVSLDPSALGLHRVGAPMPAARRTRSTAPKLNARGLPARVQKKKKMFGDDDEDDYKPKLSPAKKLAQKRSLNLTENAADDDDDDDITEDEDYEPERLEREKTVTVDKSKVFNMDMNHSRDQYSKTTLVGKRLKNLLKLPKAHKFVMFEWFYSNLDQVLFKGENEFQACVRDMFPKLAARNLSRTEWCLIRRKMGKPRRCSQAFFDEERRELERKRQKIRLLQSRKMADVSFVKHLPRQIPLPFQVGTKVTARLRAPQDGLFNGTIAAVDSITHHYRVTFDRQGLGTYTIPDFELMSMEGNETIPIVNLTQNIRKKKLASAFVANPLCALSRVDPVLSESRHETVDDDQEHMDALKEGLRVAGKESRVTVAGHPFKMVEMMVRTKKLLAAKNAKLKKLKQMNSDVAINKSYDEPITDDDQRQYANVVLSLEKINRQIHAHLTEIQTLSQYLSREPAMQAMVQPSFLREKCRQMAEQSVTKHNEYHMTDGNVLRLVSDLSTIMWVASYMSNNDQFVHVLRVLEGCVEEAKSHLDSENVDVFNANVLVHIHHIKMGVTKQQERDNQAMVEDLVEEVDPAADGEDDVEEEAATEEVLIETSQVGEEEEEDYSMAEMVELG